MKKYDSRMKKEYIGYINMSAQDCPEALVAVEEVKFREQILDICDHVISQEKSMILVSGPSSSGKTTMAKMLAGELSRRGKKTVRLSLDNFYKNRTDVPLWKNGRYNFETIESLDLETFRERVIELQESGQAEFPIFDFSTGKRSNRTFHVDFDEQTILIFEGIHALSPRFDEYIAEQRSMKIYLSAHTDFVDDNNEIVLSARDVRLVRRIIRDSWARATTAAETLDFWEDVCRGEEKYIKPYRALADVHVNSTHAYEPLLFRDEILRLLADCDEVKYDAFLERLRYGMGHFKTMSKALLPKTSLMKEFIQLDS